MRKAIFFILLLAAPLLAKGQQADSLAGTFLNQKNWFKLYDLYERDSMQMSPFLRRMSDALLLHVFNQPEKAVMSIQRFIREHQQEMGFDNLCSFISFMADDYLRSGQNKKAADILQSFVRQIDGKVGQKVVDEYKGKASAYREMAKYDLYKTDGKLHYTLPFRLTQILDSAQQVIMMHGKANGTDCDFCFDTGASYNVISKEAAMKMGLKVIGSGIKVMGTAQLDGQMVILDTISIGDMLIRHVPFIVLDMMQNNGRAAKAMQSFNYIIGQPLMSHFKSYTIDLRQHVIELSSEPIKRTLKPNLCLFNTLKVNVSKGADTFCITLDTGATSTQLGTSYYQDYAKEVARDGKWDIVKGAGAGGVAYESVFRLPKISLKIGETPFQMLNIPVTAITSKNNVLSDGYGRLGLDFFLLWKKVSIDYVNMHIELQP